MLKARATGLMALSLAVVAISTSGCKGNLYRYSDEVTGKVLCNGKPAVGGVIIFQPAEAPEKTGRPKGAPGLSSVGRIESDGTFRLQVPPRGTDPKRKGALIGPHQVSFELPPTTPAKFDPAAAQGLSEEEAAKLKETVESLPTYEPLECGSGITPNTVEVKSGANNFEFNLQPGGSTEPMNERAGRRARRRQAAFDESR